MIKILPGKLLTIVIFSPKTCSRFAILSAATMNNSFPHVTRQYLKMLGIKKWHWLGPLKTH